jgi:hypothetical protein
VGIGGYGTSNAWPGVFKGVEGSVKFFTDRAGSGGSDHGSFYAKNIPVIYFHTGGHDDYHKSTDDPDKIDAESEVGILEVQIKLIENAMKLPKGCVSKLPKQPLGIGLQYPIDLKPSGL